MNIWWCAIDNYDYLKMRRVVAQGWPAFEDVSGQIRVFRKDPKEFCENIADRLWRNAYSGGIGYGQTEFRAARAITNLLSIKAGDLVVGTEEDRVRGLCQMQFDAVESYKYNGDYEYAHEVGFPVTWIDWNNTPRPTAKQVHGIEHLHEGAELVQACWKSLSHPASH